MANPKVIQQASAFLTRMGIPYTSIKMYVKMLMINTTDYQSARIIESILNGSGVEKVGVEEPEDRHNTDYSVVGLVGDDIYGDEEEEQ